MQFDLQSEFQPTGDQPKAIEELVKGINEGEHAQTLLGVTGSGKTFTVANVIKEVEKPTLIIRHNKTLSMVNSKSSSRTIQLSFLSPITTTISLRRM